MRSLTRDHDDSGAVLVWVGLMLTVLLGIGAMVIDVGALHAERRQLQNGSDAAALAVAKDCAVGDCLNEMTTAETYADGNANDGAANVDEVCGSGPGLVACPTAPPGTAGRSNWVKVTTSTHNPANSNPTQVKYFFAPVITAFNGGTVHASAIAAWGPVGGATTIPFTFSVCEFEELGGSLDGTQFPDTPGYIYQHGNGPDHSCPGNPSGQNVPGGFGWLDSTNCQVSVVVGGWVGSDTGNSLPCDPIPWRNAEVLIPLYNDTRNSGSGAEYQIVGFAGFKVLGYKFGNNEWNMPGNAKCPGTSGNSGRCFYGEFMPMPAAGDIGSGTDFGATAIQMIG